MSKVWQVLRKYGMVLFSLFVQNMYENPSSHINSFDDVLDLGSFQESACQVPLHDGWHSLKIVLHGFFKRLERLQRDI